MKCREFAIILTGIVVLTFLPLPAAAHDETLPDTDFSGVGTGYKVDFQHDDEDPFKGWVSITVTNKSTIDWTDFHVEIFQVSGQGAVDNVHFLEGTYESQNVDPKYSLSTNYTWDIDNDVVGATLDYYFPSAVIAPDAQATFQFYTDNSDQVDIFGMAMYPTPEPATAAVVLLGGAGLLFRRRRRAA